MTVLGGESRSHERADQPRAGGRCEKDRAGSCPGLLQGIPGHPEGDPERCRAEALVIEAAEKAVDYLEQQVTQYIIGQVIEAALNPLLGVIEKSVAGMTYSALEDVLGVSGYLAPLPGSQLDV
ncbi:hypothetical protein [Streptomyces sp. NPDC003480]